MPEGESSSSSRSTWRSSAVAVAIGVAQQDELVGRWPAGSGLAEQDPGDEVGEPAAGHLAFGRAGQRHQHIAIGQGVDDARMVQPFGKAIYLKPLGRFGRGAVAQPTGSAILTVGKSAVGLGQHRVGAGVCFDRIDRRYRRAAATRRRPPPDQQHDDDSDQDFLENAMWQD